MSDMSPIPSETLNVQQAHKMKDIVPDVKTPADAPSQTTAPPMPPNGGVDAWLKVAGAFLMFINIFGFPNAFGVFEAYYAMHSLRDSSLSAISWIGTTLAFLLAALGTLAGPLYDRGYTDVLLFMSGLFFVVGVMMLSLSTQYYQIFLAQGVTIGIGVGVMYVPALALVATSFTTKRAFAISIATAGSNIGGICYTLIFQGLIMRIGFGWTIRIMGFVALGTTLLALALLRPHRTKPKPPRSLLNLKAFTEPPYVAYCAGGFLRYLGILVPYFFIPIYAQSLLGASQASSFRLLIYLNIGSFTGRLAAAWAAHVFGLMLPWFICSLASGVLCLAWIAIRSSMGTFTVWVVFYGLVAGPLFALPSAAAPLVCPLPVLGTRMGMTWALSGVAQLVGAPIAGTLAKANPTKPFLGLQVFCGVTMLASACCQLPLWWMVRDKLARMEKKSAPASVPHLAAGEQTSQGRDEEAGGKVEEWQNWQVSSWDGVWEDSHYLGYDAATGRWKLRSVFGVTQSM